MLSVIFTLDYEIHGNGEGCPSELMVEPTRRMMDLFERYGAKLTIMADVAEILKFNEYKERVGRDDYHYDAIATQLRDAIRRGHDVQLHLHPSYFKARHEAGSWSQDWSEYNFAGLPFERLNEIVCLGKRYLEGLLKPLAPDYECIAFRAANWAVSPSRNVVRALVNNGIRIETSVFKHGRRDGIVSFDYSHAPSNLVPWLADEDDICRQSRKSRLVEVPIYSERRWIGAFVTLQRVHRAWLSRQHRVVSGNGDGHGDPNVIARSKNGLATLFQIITQRHAWKADFNQCSGRQLIQALERAVAVHDRSGEALPFVLIGHSKLFSRYNERNVEPFLDYVARYPARFQFGKFKTLNLPVRY